MVFIYDEIHLCRLFLVKWPLPCSFDFATEHDQSRIKINNWIASETKNKILDMIPEDILDADTLLVLANAIYFKGAWQRPFDQKQTTKMNFVVDENHHREVDMMFAEYMALSSKDCSCSVEKFKSFISLP
jgi:serine protease inhibitor